MALPQLAQIEDPTSPTGTRDIKPEEFMAGFGNPATQLQFLIGLARRSGTGDFTVPFSMGGYVVPVVVVSSEEGLNRVYTDKRFVRGKMMMAYTDQMGFNIANTPDPQHANMRNPLNPRLSESQVNTQTAQLIAIAQEHFDTLRDGERIDITSLMKKLVWDLLCVAQFGTKVDPLIGQALDQFLQHSLMASYMPAARPTFEQLGAMARGFVAHMYHQRNAQEDPGTDLMGIMVSLVRRGEWSLDDALANLLAFYLAGQETTFSAAATATAYACLNPQIWSRIHDVALALPDNYGADELRHAIDYIQQAIWEALRLWAPAPYSFRETAEDVQWGEYLLPAGTQILTAPGVYNRLEQYWQNPDECIPERMDKDTIRRVMSFGGGPTYCIGARLALRELAIILVGLARTVARLELLTPEAEFGYTSSTTVRPGSIFAVVHK